MDESITWIGNRQNWGGDEPFGFSASGRRQHAYIVGQTGTGKSTLLKNLILQDIEAGNGVALLDPHGDLATELLDHYPSRRSDDLVYFDPGDRDHPIAFNPLANVAIERRHLVVSGIVVALKSIWRESFGPRMEYILRMAVSALLDCECPNITLLGLQRMLSDTAYRGWIVRHLKDPVVRNFWQNEFEQYDERFRKEAVAPIQNKVGQILLSPPVRNIFGQVKSKIDFRFMMDHRRVFIANLSKGRLGEDNSNLVGALLVAQLQQAAMSRADSKLDERVPFYAFVDEFQNFTSDTFGSILSESRKYALSITLSHQYLDQLPSATRDAVFGNVANLIAFRVGEADAVVLAREYGHAFAPEEFAGQSNHHVLVRNIERGVVRAPFRGITIPTDAPRSFRKSRLIARSRERYGTNRRIVEDRIDRWLNHRPRQNKRS